MPDSPLPATLGYDSVEVGQELPSLPIPITTTLIVSGAIASRDYQDVHHDTGLAAEKGAPDIFMNILTTNGLVGRYITDWAGPDCVLRKVAIRLGVPNYPGDEMTLSGEVAAKEIIDGSGQVDVKIVGANQLGNHVMGTVSITLPLAGAEGS